MDVIAEIYYKLNAIEEQVSKMQQTGVVTAIHAEDGLVDVAIEELVLERIPFFTRRAGEDKTYWMPSVGEKGAVLSPSGNLANAMFLPSLNSDINPVPRDAAKWTVREWSDGAVESYDKDAHVYVLEIDADTLRKMLRGEIEDKVGNARRVAKSGEIKDEIGGTQQVVEPTKVKHIAGSNTEELTAIVLNLIGAHLFPNGITTLQSPVGPCFFAPAPQSPNVAPMPPAGSAPNTDGEVTKTPPSRISGVAIQATSNVVITLTAPVPVVTPTGAGTIAAGTQIRGTVTGTINLQFPARDL